MSILVPDNILQSLHERNVTIETPQIMLGKSKVRLVFDYMIFAPDLSSATPVFKAEIYDRPERKPRKPRTTAQPTNKNKK